MKIDQFDKVSELVTEYRSTERDLEQLRERSVKCVELMKNDMSANHYAMRYGEIPGYQIDGKRFASFIAGHAIAWHKLRLAEIQSELFSAGVTL